MKVAITGKGGVGKTTIAAILARTMARSGRAVVAVDADPNPNLALALGLGLDEAARVGSVANFLVESDIADAHAPHDGHSHDHGPNPQGEGTEGQVEHLLATLGVAAPDGVRLLQCGRIERPSGGCLCCGSHHVSRRIFDELDSQDRVVVADLEAGVNDLMWIWPKDHDVVLIVTEPYQKALEVASRALQVTRELGVGRVLAVANRVTSGDELDQVRSQLPGISVAQVPDDRAVADAGTRGVSPVDAAPDCPGVQAVVALASALQRVSGAAGSQRLSADQSPADLPQTSRST